MIMPLVSVIIPTYKRPSVIGRAVESVLRQTYSYVEILVVDDNGDKSPFRPPTETAMAPFASDPKVRYIKHPENRNGSAARNTGIRAAHGTYIAFLDDDDEFMPPRIAAMVSLMESLDLSWGACYSRFVRRNGERILDYGAERAQGELYHRLLLRNFYICAGSNMFVRRTVLDEIGGFNETFRRYQDIELLLRITSRYKLACLDAATLVVHKDVREYRATIDGFERVNEHFLTTFAAELAALPLADQRRLQIRDALEYARFALGRRRGGLAISRLRKARVPPWTLVRYAAYLMRRKTRKLCYGFVV